MDPGQPWNPLAPRIPRQCSAGEPSSDEETDILLPDLATIWSYVGDWYLANRSWGQRQAYNDAAIGCYVAWPSKRTG
jgi:hypothetical protein